MANEIWVLSFFGQGHLLPLMELCKHLAQRNFKTTFAIPSHLSSAIPSSFRQYPNVHIAEISSAPETQPERQAEQIHQPPHHHDLDAGLENLLSQLDCGRPICAIVDVMISSTGEVFRKFEIPTVTFFTSGACSAAMEDSISKVHPDDLKPGEVRLLPGLPEEMAISYSDFKMQSRGPPIPHGAGGPPGRGAGFPPPLHGPVGSSGRGDGAGFAPHPHGSHGPPGGGAGFQPPPGMPPRAGDKPPWFDESAKSIALMFNTCDDLERPFIEYVGKAVGKPVWGVGPLLPEKYWKSVGSVVRDREIRSDRQSNFTEDQVLEWLDSKPRGSVLYVAFGTEVGPTAEEYKELESALEESTRPFIWVIPPGAGRHGPPNGPPPGAGRQGPPGGPPPGAGRQGPPPGLNGPNPRSDSEEGYFPEGLDRKIGTRGMIIRGWAPQLLILSHPSTGGFLSHCGWNSTIEAIGRGVPILAWPIRGDQYHNATLVAAHLKVGYPINDNASEEAINKGTIGKGIEKLMSDEEIKKRAATLSDKFEHGFPSSSMAALDGFREFITHRKC